MKQSSSRAPDLDWSQVSETVHMLTLSIAQIELSLRSGDESVLTLTNSFTQMAKSVEHIQATASNLDASENQASIISECNQVSAQMQHVIVAFQFYDKLTQRLSHLSRALANVSTLVKTPEQLYNPTAWSDLQQDIKTSYTVEADTVMFDAILNGSSAEQALIARTVHKEAKKSQQDDDDVELF